MITKRTLLSAALASALAVSFGATAQNVSEGEIDQTTGQPANAQQGGQANTNELKDPATSQAQPGAPTAATGNQGSQSQGGQSTGQSQQQGAQAGQSAGQSQGGQSGQAAGQSQPSGQSGQGTADQSQQQGSERRPAEGPAQGQVGPGPNHSTTGETTGQGQGVKDTGGEAAAGTHQDQGGDPGRGATGHTGTGTGTSTEVTPQQSQ